MGYDGKGQGACARADVRRVRSHGQGHLPAGEDAAAGYEVSVLTARGHDGESVVYPIAENVHRDGILFTTTVPGPNVSDDCAAAQQAAQAIVAELGYVGVLCIEFFVLTDGTLVVNEMAPRPHNSGHYTMDACVTSQFEQQVRAMARLPLGDVRQHSPAVMLNILGDVWFEGDSDAREPAWDQVLALPGANLHLYGKDDPRRGRKMGHLTFIAPTLAQAQQQLRRLRHPGIASSRRHRSRSGGHRRCGRRAGRGRPGRFPDRDRLRPRRGCGKPGRRGAHL
jgi:5-(carboxyamino)imidazole ribonucleotide synthase